MEQILNYIPKESLFYHAGRNHISTWLMARTEFKLAKELREKHVTEFNDIEDVRKYIIKSLHELRTATNKKLLQISMALDLIPKVILQNLEMVHWEAKEEALPL